ncbi:MAG: hypothetical protein AAF734_00360, partial [Bacteroidota bacterium]
MKEELSPIELRKVKDFLTLKKEAYGDIINSINNDISEANDRQQKEELQETKTSIKNLRTILNEL